jgi:hypothetical protein
VTGRSTPATIEAKAAREKDGGHIMKSVTARDLQKKVKECVDLAQKERVVVTRHGKPAAGVEGKDWEDILLEISPSFWQLIEKRRKHGRLHSRS